MKKLWNRWCKKVDRHNRYIDYGNYEDAWSPENIFTPFILALVVAVGVFCVTICNFKEFCFADLMGLIGTGIFSLINWQMVENENKKIDSNKINVAHCHNCGYDFKQFEYCVETKEGQIFCERCYLDMALEETQAKQKKVDFNFNVGEL